MLKLINRDRATVGDWQPKSNLGHWGRVAPLRRHHFGGITGSEASIARVKQNPSAFWIALGLS